MHLDPWTLALQTINVLVLVWLLAHFLFRPVAGIIAARRAATDALMADAEAARAKAATEASALAQQRQELANDGDRIAAAARAAAEAERTTILRQANDAAAQLRTEAQQALARDQQAMRESLEHDAGDLAVTIAMRLLERMPPQLLNRAFLEGLGEVLAAHPARASLLTAPIEVRSAVPLDADLQVNCRAMLVRLLGATPETIFRTDPTLVAGIELASPHAVIRNSWRDDLAKVAHALHEDTGHEVAPQHVA
jgi:F-type H+-transporting ATPase subunit b